MKIVLVSDNHNDEKTLKKIVQEHPDADLYLHCGDSQMSKQELYPFRSVRGNNDYFEKLPEKMIIPINEHIKLMMIHGDRLGYFNHEEQLSSLAKENSCQIICSGHTHVPMDKVVNGIRVLNPGSTTFPRSMIGRTYMILNIEDTNVDVQLVKLSK